jgi:hypothetical protein
MRRYYTTLLDDLARYGMPTQVKKAACDFACH